MLGRPTIAVQFALRPEEVYTLFHSEGGLLVAKMASSLRTVDAPFNLETATQAMDCVGCPAFLLRTRARLFNPVADGYHWQWFWRGTPRKSTGCCIAVAGVGGFRLRCSASQETRNSHRLYIASRLQVSGFDLSICTVACKSRTETYRTGCGRGD
jgi:hypothetical protein